MNDLGPEARAILKAGRDGDEPSATDRARLRRSLSRAIAAGGAAAAAASGAEAAAAVATGKAVSFTLAAKVLAGVLCVGALGAGAWMLGAPPAPSSSTAVPAAATTSAEVVETAAPLPSAIPSNQVSAAPTSAPMQRPAPSARAPSAPGTGAEPETLEDETRRLREAHAALQSGDADKALALLDEQAAAYSDGQLRQERAAARVLTLCKLGKLDEARAAAATFLSENPRSPLADRVRGGCPAAKAP